tara:strand:+ start:18830 stop:20245 length:1416 start_codon:yes stop_codon:yes gene_type:complete
MATIRRAGFGTVFELEDSKVGIGTDAATHTLQALGNIRSEGVQDVGVSTLTTYQGFTDKEARFTGGQIDFESQSGSTSGEIVIDGNVTVSSATTFTSGPQHLTVTDTFTLPSGDTNSRELKPTAGSLRFNQDFATLEFYTGNNWATVNTFTEIQNSPSNRGRGVIGGGYSYGFPSTAGSTSIEFVNIPSQGNSINFGDLTGTYRTWISAFSSSIRGIWSCGSDYPGNNVTNIMDYITIASEGNAIDFGDGTYTGSKQCCGNSIRGLGAGGYNPSPGVNRNIIEYSQIATLGNALDFGDLETATRGMGTSASPIRGIFAGGQRSSNTSDIQSVTIASTGNAVKFGELTSVRRMDGGGQVTNSVRGVFWNAEGKIGGTGATSPAGTAMDYITLASGGNAVLFADGLTVIDDPASTSNMTRGIFAGSGPSSAQKNNIDFITIATTGNAQDFGDLDRPKQSAGGCSDSHGGLGGF